METASVSLSKTKKVLFLSLLGESTRRGIEIGEGGGRGLVPRATSFST